MFLKTKIILGVFSLVPLQIVMGEGTLLITVVLTILLTLAIGAIKDLIMAKLNLGVRKDELSISSSQHDQLKMLQETMLVKIQEMHAVDKKELEDKFKRLEERNLQCDEERHEQMLEIKELKDKLDILTKPN